MVRSKRVLYVKSLGYIVNDPAIAKQILRDSEHFSIKEAGGIGDLIAELWGTTPTLLSMDGDEHKKVKFALLDLFSDDNLDSIISEELANFAKRLKTKVVSPDGCDVALETKIATNRITMKLLGINSIEDGELLRLSGIITMVMDCIDIRYKTFTDKNRIKALQYVEELKQIAKSYYAVVPANTDCIITRLKQLGYNNESGYGFIAMFMVAGTVTVSSALPRIISLLTETNQLSILKDRPERIPVAVDEGLRHTTPGPVLLHGVKKTTSIGSYTAKKGSRVLILLYNIMHDPHYTQKPFRFDVTRTQNELINGLWFGTGAHFCMGSLLAKKEIATVLETLAPFADTVRITGRSYMQDGINPGLKSLVIKA